MRLFTTKDSTDRFMKASETGITMNIFAENVKDNPMDLKQNAVEDIK